MSLGSGGNDALLIASVHGKSGAGDGIVEVTAGVVAARSEPRLGIANRLAGHVVAGPGVEAQHAGRLKCSLHLVASHEDRIAGESDVADGKKLILIVGIADTFGAHLKELCLCAGIEAEDVRLLSLVESKHISGVALGNLAADCHSGKCIDRLLHEVLAHIIARSQFQPLLLEGVGIVVGGVSLIAFSLKLDNRISGFVGSYRIGDILATILLIEFPRRLVSRSYGIDCVVVARLKVLKYEHAIIFTVGGIFGNLLAALVERNHSEVDRLPDVHRVGVRVI